MPLRRRLPVGLRPGLALALTLSAGSAPVLAPGPLAARATAEAASEPALGASQDPDAPLPLYERLVRRADTLRSEGRWQDALALWEEAADDVAGRGLDDLRIGVAYMETAVAQEADSLHARASRLYLAGLSGEPTPESLEELNREMERVLLIAGPGTQTELERLRDAPPRARALALKRFWLERDPTPSTALNERLVEHWQRIASARERFVYNTSSPIGTDDRGVVYLRYGAPPKTQRGYLGASEMEMKIRIPQDDLARERLRQMDTNPQYEVWMYDRLNPREFTTFLFGNLDGTGRFQLVDGVHRLIPSQSRSRNNARYVPGNIPASHYLELFYYADLAAIGGIFGERFAQLDLLWNSYTARDRSGLQGARVAPRESELEALEFRFRTEDEFDPRGAPRERSWSAWDARPRDPLVAQSVRILSDDDQPLVLVIASAGSTLDAGRLAPDASGSRAGSASTMRHTLIIRDGDYSEVGRLVQLAEWEGTHGISSFVLRHPPQPLHLTISARTLVAPPADSAGTPGAEAAAAAPADSRGDTLVASSRLPGRAHLDPGRPLDPDPAHLEMSDLVVGMAPPPDFDPRTLPFDVLPSTRIWRRDPVRFYAELYHLALDGGAGRVEAAFQVIPLDGDGAPDPERDVITIDDVRLEPESSTWRQFFDLSLRDQRPGRYRLVVTFTDTVRGETVQRTAEFDLVE